MSTLRRLRSGKGKTVREVALDLGVTERTYSRWERDVTLPEAENLVKVARYFGIPESEIVGSGRAQTHHGDAA